MGRIHMPLHMPLLLIFKNSLICTSITLTVNLYASSHAVAVVSLDQVLCPFIDPLPHWDYI